MRKAILLFATTALVLGSALVALAQTDDPADPERPLMTGIEQVLADLVDDETLSQEQADAVVGALEAKREELRTEREAVREQLQEFWADDQLSQEEIDQLPEWHRWSQMDELLDDGAITRDEIRQMRRLDRFGPRHGFGH